MSNPTHCPHCGADFQGEPIPKEHQHLFNAIGAKPGDPGWNTHFSRVISLYSRERDRTVAWRCPDCGYTWDRK